MTNPKNTKQTREIRALRKSGMSLSRAERYAQDHRRKSGLVLAATLCLSVGYVGIAAVYGLRAFSPSPEVPVQTVRVEVPVPVEQPITAEVREEIYQVERARRADLAPPPAPVVSEPPVVLAAAPDAAPDCVDRIAMMAQDVRLPFAVGSVTPEGTALQNVTAFAAAAQTCPEALVSVAGHSDSTGTEYLNMQLSWARAENTIRYLADVGLDTDAFRPIGYGTRMPAAEGDADSDDAVNRRVDFSVARRTRIEN